MPNEDVTLDQAVANLPSGDNVTAPVEQPGTPAAAVSLEQFNELKARFDKVSAFADRIKADEKAEREKRQDAVSQRDALQEKDSQSAELIAALGSQNEALTKALETVQPIVEARQAEVDKAKATVAERMENGLPSYMKTALDGWEADPLRALNAIQDFDASQTQPSGTSEVADVPQPALSNSTSGTPGNEIAQVDFGRLMAEGASLADLKQRYAAQWAEQVSSVNPNPTVKTDSYLSGMFAGSAGSTKGQ